MYLSNLGRSHVHAILPFNRFEGMCCFKLGYLQLPYSLTIDKVFGQNTNHLPL